MTYPPHTPPTRLVGAQYTDLKGKNANIGWGPHFTPLSTFSVWDRGGCGFVVPVNIWGFLSSKNSALREKTTPTKHVVPVWCPWCPLSELDDFVQDLLVAVSSIHLFSGYLFTLKQRRNSVLALIGAHPPKLFDQVAMLNAFFPGLFNVPKHFLDVCFSE